MEILGQAEKSGVSHSTCGQTSDIMSWKAFNMVLTCQINIPEFQ